MPSQILAIRKTRAHPASYRHPNKICTGLNPPRFPYGTSPGQVAAPDAASGVPLRPGRDAPGGGRGGEDGGHRLVDADSRP